MFFEQSCATKTMLVMSVVVDPDAAGVTLALRFSLLN